MSVAGKMMPSLFALAVTLCSAETASAQLSPDAQRGLILLSFACIAFAGVQRKEARSRDSDDGRATPCPP
jgi:hypothetical protein